MRTAFSTLALIAAIAAPGQDVNGPISFTTKAIPTRVALQELSKQAGINLETTSDMEEEPIILRLDHVPLKVVMDKMADVYGADWVDHHGFWRLERSDDKVTAIKKRLFKARVQAVKASMDELTKIEAKQKPIDEPEAESMITDALAIGKLVIKDHAAVGDRQFTFGTRMPYMRFAVKELARMDPEELASIGDHRRVVYSLTPNGMQRQLPPVDPDDFAQLHQQCTVLKQAMDKLKPDFSFGTQGVTMDEDVSFEAGSAGLSSPTHLLVIATRTGRVIDLLFSSMDDRGIQNMEDSESVGVSWASYFRKREKDGVLAAKAQQDGFALGPVAGELAARLGHLKSELKPISKATLDVLLDPVDTDPLGLATSDTLLTGAEKDGLNVIALPTEETEPIALQCAQNGKTSLERFEAALKDTETDLTVEDGWVTLKPIDPLEAAAERVPRAALQAYYRSLTEAGFVSLETFSKLRYACSRDAGLEVPMLGTHLLLNSDEWFMLARQCPDRMRFYGSLTDDEREAARKGTLTFNFANLSGEQQEMIRSLIFDSSSPWFSPVKRTLATPIWNPERTNALPNGVPMNTRITLEDRSTRAIFFKGISFRGTEYTSMPMDIESGAREILQAQHPEVFPGEMHLDASGWMLGGQRTLDVKVLEGDDYQTEDFFQEASSPKTKPLPLSQFLASLPEDLRTEIQNDISKMLLAAPPKAISSPEPEPAPAVSPPG